MTRYLIGLFNKLDYISGDFRIVDEGTTPGNYQAGIGVIEKE